MELEKENVVPPDENVAEPVAKRAKLDTSVKKQNGDNQKEIVVVDLCDTDSEEDLEEAIRRSLSDPKESSEGASAIAMPNVAESHMVSFPTSYLKDTQSSNSSPDITNSSIDSIYDEDEQVKNALILSCSKSDQPEVVSSKNNDTEEDVKPKALLDTFEDEDDEAKPDSAPFSSHITIDTDDETDQPLACPSSALTSRTKTFRPAINLADLSDSDDDDFVVPEASPFAAKVTIKRDKGLTRFSSDPDKALQILLWKLGFGDTLHVHQTMAVRRVAGVPEDFPLHKQSKATLQSMDLTLAAMGLPEPSTKGILLADEMGIGKTIESIAGMILVNALETYKTGKQRPSVIIVPNTAVLEQWIEALKRNGVRRDRIHKFEKSKILRNDQNAFILMEKSKLQIEVKAIFDGITNRTFTPKTSFLFPHVLMNEFNKLRNQYMAAKGKVKNKYKRKREAPDDCVRRLVNDIAKRLQRAVPSFRTVVIDEAHFLKNNLAYWGISGLLLSLHCERCIPMSGTPYNNGPQDLAACMAYIDVGLDSARRGFWVKALAGGAETSVRHALKEWNKDFLVRRRKDEVLTKLLGKKTIETKVVEQHPDEIFLQEHYERQILKILKKFSEALNKGNSPLAVANQQRVYTILMACISCARAAAIHPMLPSGREWTKQFSPSRRRSLAKEERPDVCVCCNQSLRPTVPIDKKLEDEDKKEKSSTRAIRRAAGDMDLDDENLDDEEVEDVEREKNEVLVPLPEEICRSLARHFVHEKCLDAMQLLGEKCPRCADGARRIHMRKDDASLYSSECYCQHIEAIPGEPGGFIGSSKIKQIVDYVKESVPKEDKVLILSFFKGSLDLLEGVFEEELDFRCARFDGDFGPMVAKEELDRFRKTPDVKVLLATVQSGGTGLNIVEANHVVFIDRWFNPFVHDQAMDRCYRIGQKKDVYVNFFDCGGSMDEVMAILNKYKSQNASVVLTDGTELGANSGGNLSYQEVSGLLSRALEAVSSNRADHVNLHGRSSLLPATGQALIQAVLDNAVAKYNEERLREAMARAASNAAASGPDITDSSSSAAMSPTSNPATGSSNPIESMLKFISSLRKS